MKVLTCLELIIGTIMDKTKKGGLAECSMNVR